MLTFDGKCLKQAPPLLGVTISDAMVDPTYKALPGDLVYLDDSKNLYRVCTLDSLASASANGLVLSAAKDKGKGFLMATPGMILSLKAFGTLAEFNAQGATNTGWLGANGRLSGVPKTGRDVNNRRVIVIPKRFQDLKQEDLDMAVVFLTDPAVHTT